MKRRVTTRTVIPDESMVLVGKPKEPLDLSDVLGVFRQVQEEDEVWVQNI